jgi:hypothetical protein
MSAPCTHPDGHWWILERRESPAPAPATPSREVPGRCKRCGAEKLHSSVLAVSGWGSKQNDVLRESQKATARSLMRRKGRR